MYARLKQQREMRNAAQTEVFQIKEQVKQTRSAIYRKLYGKVRLSSVDSNGENWLNASGKQGRTTKQPVPPPPPTVERPGHEDSAEYIQTSTLTSEAEKQGRQIVYSGTDYGVTTMATTIRMTPERADQRLRLFNYFSPLETDEATDELPSADDFNDIPENDECHRVTSGEVSQLSLARKFTKKRETRKVGSLAARMEKR